jgi:hypothetical protein
MKNNRRHYIVLSLLALVFIAPGISAYFFYMHPQWLGHTTINKGRLLNPPQLLTSLTDNSPATKWQLILWSPTACEKKCLKQLDKLARIRLALGRRLYDVTPRLLLGAQASPLSQDLINTLADQDITVVQLPLTIEQQIPALQNHLEIFIANPENYLVLAYQTTVKPADIFHDIKHLLTTADKAGSA